MNIVAKRSLRRHAFFMVLALVVQSGFGVAANLYVSVPSHHSGANPGNYLTGSMKSLLWALAHGGGVLLVHSALGLLVALFAIRITAQALAGRRRDVTTWSILGLLFVVGAGFNGASFLDYNKDVSSLIMALLAFAAIACYSTLNFVLAES